MAGKKLDVSRPPYRYMLQGYVKISNRPIFKEFFFTAFSDEEALQIMRKRYSQVLLPYLFRQVYG